VGKCKCRTIIIMRPKMERIKTEMFGQLIEHPHHREEGRVKFHQYHELRDSFQQYKIQRKRMGQGLPLNPTPEYRREPSSIGVGWTNENLQVLNQIEVELKRR